MRTRLLVSDADKHALHAGEGVGFALLPVTPTDAGQVPGRYPVQLRIGTRAPIDVDGPHTYWTRCDGRMELLTQQAGEAWRIVEFAQHEGGVVVGELPTMAHVVTGAAPRLLEAGVPAGSTGYALPAGARRLALYFAATATTAKLVVWWRTPSGAWQFADAYDFTSGTPPAPVQVLDIPPGAQRVTVQRVAGGSVTVEAVAEF